MTEYNLLWTRDDRVVKMSRYGPDSLGSSYGGSMVGAVYLMRSDGALLMQLRDQKMRLRHAGLWVPPGGHMDTEETLEQVARREFKEETLIHCTHLRWLDALEVELQPWPTYLLANFWCIYDNVQTYECREGQDLRFIERERAKEIPMPTFVVETWDRILSQMHSTPMN